MDQGLEQYYINLELINDTAQQIIKDFGIYGEEIKFSGDPATAYQELSRQVEPILSKLIDSNYQKLLEVLYRIDVSEKEIASAVENNDADGISAAITILVIRRELQKVVTRKIIKP